jgi:pimeloyl-ACP methyl ester carboxylesterase
MTVASFQVQGVDVYVQGQGDHTLVLLQGWPDTHVLWDHTLQAVATRYRCVRFTLPGNAGPTTVRSLPEMTALLLEIVDRVSPGQPVSLLLHDWGCVFGYELAARHPQRVARIVAVDVGDHNTPFYLAALRPVHKAMVLCYQLFLAVAWVAGRSASVALGNWLTRAMAFALRCPTPRERIHWYMGFPYAMQWFGTAGGLRRALPVRVQGPTLYIYGKRKPFMFHSPQWIEQLNATQGCKAVGMEAGHWVMLDQTQAFEDLLLEWLVANTEKYIRC